MGSLCYPAHTSAKILFEEVVEFQARNPGADIQYHFVVHDQRTYQEFQKEFNRRRIAESDERRRIAESDERRRIAESDERRRIAESDERRIAESDERRRIAESDEKRRIADENRRKADEKRRKADEKRQQHRIACKKVIEKKLKVRLRAVRFNYVGLPRSGKTSFLRRLMKEILNILEARRKGEKEQPSTGVAEAGGQVIIRNTTNSSLGAISSKEWSIIRDLLQEGGLLSQIFYQAAKDNPSMDSTLLSHTPSASHTSHTSSASHTPSASQIPSASWHASSASHTPRGSRPKTSKLKKILSSILNSLRGEYMIFLKFLVVTLKQP